METFVKIVEKIYQSPKLVLFLCLSAIVLLLLLMYTEDDSFLEFFFHFGYGPAGHKNTPIFVKTHVDTLKKLLLAYLLSFLAGFLIIFASIPLSNIISHAVLGEDISVHSKYTRGDGLILIFLYLLITVFFNFGITIFNDALQLQFVIFFLLGGMLMGGIHVYTKTYRKNMRGAPKKKIVIQ